MTSRRQRFWTAYARWVQKPALALVRPVGPARALFVLNAIGAYRTPRGLRVTATDLGGVPAARCALADAPEPRGTLLYIHGGAFIMGHPRGYRHLVAELARASGQDGLYIDYRLAPEHPYPAAVDDAEAAYRALLARGGPITLAGDSAGGNIALALLLRIKARGLPMPAACALFSPATDLRGGAASLTENARADALVPVAWAERGAKAYCGASDPATPEISPVLGDFTGAPPVMIQVDDSEVLRDDSLAIARTLRRCGVEVTLERNEGCFHVWQLLVGRTPEADEAVAEVGRFLAKFCSTGPGSR